MTSTPSPDIREYTAHVWCDRPFTARFSVTADSPEAALAKAKERVNDEDGEECDSGYPWDTFTVEDAQGTVVASEEPPDAIHQNITHELEMAEKSLAKPESL
jgi:hypothetical protein